MVQVQFFRKPFSKNACVTPAPSTLFFTQHCKIFFGMQLNTKKKKNHFHLKTFCNENILQRNKRSLTRKDFILFAIIYMQFLHLLLDISHIRLFYSVKSGITQHIQQHNSSGDRNNLCIFSIFCQFFFTLPSKVHACILI